MKKIKLIWDFRGPEALNIAEHHAIHLEEFAKKEELDFVNHGTIAFSDYHVGAYITVGEKDLNVYRDALKPHRGVHADEE